MEADVTVSEYLTFVDTEKLIMLFHFSKALLHATSQEIDYRKTHPEEFSDTDKLPDPIRHDEV